eukprot:jgi/Chrpa1/22438/Chrysochromulina_OHIO_Genome00008437-RA
MTFAGRGSPLASSHTPLVGGHARASVLPSERGRGEGSRSIAGGSTPSSPLHSMSSSVTDGGSPSTRTTGRCTSTCFAASKATIGVGERSSTRACGGHTALSALVHAATRCSFCMQESR